MARAILAVVAVVGACLGLGPGLVLAQKSPEGDDARPWAFRPPVRPHIPAVKNSAWIRNPVDAFIAAKREGRGLSPAPESERAVLIRRLSFDLIGLPPTPEDVDAFVSDQQADAYERLVDRLLASPQYGERWATYWLDLVRFAESDGFKADDPRPTAWRYRDYVIKGLNEDRPYDRFLHEQLAGDELFPATADALMATAYLRNYPDEHNAKNLALRRQEILNDVTDTTGQVFLGLTLGCARCHDHKFDPISQKDYFRLQAFFAALSPRDDLPLPGQPDAKHVQELWRRWQRETAEVRRRMDEVEKPYLETLIQSNKTKYAAELREAYDTPPAQRTPLQQQLADLLAKQLPVGRQGLPGKMKPEVRKEWQDLSKELARFDNLKPAPLPITLGVIDIGPVAPATFLLKRGNMSHPGAEVQPGFLSAIGPSGTVSVPTHGAQTTGRRSALAHWLTRPDNPLTARVMVNRLWQHHFGRGLAGTPSDFGAQGEAPTHPELLDWLACEFVARGWSLKVMHRLLVTSATYRLSSRWDAAAARADPDNRLLWRMSRRRLEGEALRDAMLRASGLLNPRMAGPSVFPELPADLPVTRGWSVTPDPRERNRRSIYVFAKRNQRLPIFSAFDAPEGNETCARRNVSTNAPQALMLLNSKLTLDVARAFAGRVLNEVGTEPGRAITRAYRLALDRNPDSKEEKLALDFLRRQGQMLGERLASQRPVALPDAVRAPVDPAFAGAVVEFCHVLLNLNELAYVD
jgi:hypothetical protein